MPIIQIYLSDDEYMKFREQPQEVQKKVKTTFIKFLNDEIGAIGKWKKQKQE